LSLISPLFPLFCRCYPPLFRPGETEQLQWL